MIACFWVLMGLIGYVRQRYHWSAVAFVLVIASRQYMLAFPAEIATYEFIVALVNVRQIGTIHWREQWRWIAPALAACSILGWFYLFQGLAPASAYRSRPTPEIQTTLWAIEPGGAIHYLAFISLYIVIPEFLLFNTCSRLRSWRAQWGQEKYRVGIIALGLLLFMLVFPPPEFANGNVVKLAGLLSHGALRWGFYYLLALLACVRFAKPNLMAFLIFFNADIMVKAHPWNRYVLPMLVAFWYLISLDAADQFSIPWRPLSLKRRSRDLSSPQSI